MAEAARKEDGMAIVGKLVLESRLQDWAREWGGGRYATLGFSTGEHVLARLIEFGGFLPGSTGPRGGASLTMADEVEAAVRMLSKYHPAHARVIRCDYFAPNMAMDSRLDMLRRQGHKMGRKEYASKLESAKMYVEALL